MQDGLLFSLSDFSGRGGMASKIEAATSAVAPGSKCTACVVTSGADLNSIRAIFGTDNTFGDVGTLFLTPDSLLEKQAIKDAEGTEVSFLESQDIIINFLYALD
jgi:glutamate 5-kinase